MSHFLDYVSLLDRGGRASSLGMPHLVSYQTSYWCDYVVVVVVEIFVHGAIKATVTNAPQSQLNK